jgi:hypothetical protein
VEYLNPLLYRLSLFLLFLHFLSPRRGAVLGQSQRGPRPTAAPAIAANNSWDKRGKAPNTQKCWCLNRNGAGIAHYMIESDHDDNVDGHNDYDDDYDEDDDDDA